MHGSGEELGGGGFGVGEFGFQGVTQGQQLGDLGDDSLLLGEGRKWKWVVTQESERNKRLNAAGRLLSHVL